MIVEKTTELILDPHTQDTTELSTGPDRIYYVLKGKCDIETLYRGDTIVTRKLTNETYSIGENVSHRLLNPFDEPCHILEVQLNR